MILFYCKDVHLQKHPFESSGLFFDNWYKRINLFWSYYLILALKILGALARNHQSLQKIKPIKPVAKYPVRFSFFVLAGLPACRFDGALSYRGFPTFPNNLVQWYGNLSGHGRGGGCAKNIIFLSHSLLAFLKTRPTPNKETNFDVKSSKGFKMSNESLHHKEKMQKVVLKIYS